MLNAWPGIIVNEVFQRINLHTREDKEEWGIKKKSSTFGIRLWRKGIKAHDRMISRRPGSALA